MPVRPAPHRLTLAVMAVAALGFAATGCDSSSATSGGNSAASSTTHGANVPAVPTKTEPSVAPAAVISTNVDKGATDVAVDTAVSVRAHEGTLDAVRFARVGGDQPISGRFNAAHTRWTAGDLLEPGTHYLLSAKANNADGRSSQAHTPFQTRALTLDEQTYPSMTPLDGEKVGVGMPVFVQFDVPVKNHAAFERHMHVSAKPETVGSWHWVSDTEAHWRPRQYWQPDTRVHVDLDLNGVAAGNGIYGQMDRSLDFTVGRSVIMQANIRSDEMRVMVDGRLARTIPITGGKPGFETRSGTKLIVEKFESKRMDAATVGIQPGDPEYYNIPEVEYAQRVTFSGEFLHAAPWSTGDQGVSNVSHGCVGMSTANGAWLFNLTLRGAPVEVTGTERGLESGNGWTDWNQSFADYKQASALS
ncbi:MAG: Ig-like domain-containing protein [Nocardioidaceae bacterium]